MFKQILLGSAVLATLVAFTPAGARSARPVLTFRTMFPVHGAFVGPDNPINGLAGDDLPWTLAGAKGSLDSGGHVQIRLKGLQAAKVPVVPVQEPARTFRAVLSCLTEDSGGQPVPATVVTRDFAATPQGDCDIDDQLVLPSPCVAPVLFVVGASDSKWLAVSGVQSD